MHATLPIEFTMAVNDIIKAGKTFKTLHPKRGSGPPSSAANTKH